MPNRVIRDSILDSPRYHGAPVEARLLYLELLLLADDYGLVPIYPLYLQRKSTVCCGKTDDFSHGIISVLSDLDLLRTYANSLRTWEIGVPTYAYIPRFGNVARAKKPKWPVPPLVLLRNENSALAEFCIADAPQMQTDAQLPISDAPETETVTETVLNPASLQDVSPAFAGRPVAIAAPCPHEQIIAAFHELLPTCPRIRVWTSARRKHLASRWRENARRQSLAWWQKLFEFINQSDFLTGRSPARGDGRDPFVVSLDWLVKSEENLVKVIEGRYHVEAA